MCWLHCVVRSNRVTRAPPPIVVAAVAACCMSFTPRTPSPFVSGVRAFEYDTDLFAGDERPIVSHRRFTFFTRPKHGNASSRYVLKTFRRSNAYLAARSSDADG